MYYCEKCMLLSEGPRCARCGGKKLRAPGAGDFCFLDERGQMWAGMLCDVLEQGGIPCVQRSVLGAGVAMRVGANLERVRVYVPFERLDEARELVGALFRQDGAGAPE